MRATIFAISAIFLFPFASYSADEPKPQGIIKNGVEWSIGANEALPLVRGEKAAYIFYVAEGKVSLSVDANPISNILGSSTVLLVGKEIDLLTKFSNGRASRGTIQRVSTFTTNQVYSSLKQGLTPAVFPLARLDSARSFSFTVEGYPKPDVRLPECKDTSNSYVRLIVDGSPIMEPGSPNEDARFANNSGYMGKAKSIDWAIAGPQTCSFSVLFSLVD